MKITALIPALPLAFMSSMAFSQNIDVQVTNLTHGLHFTPLFISSHTSNSNVFEVGQTASAALKPMAEGGSIADLIAASPAGSVNSENPVGGLLAPAITSPVVSLDTGANDKLSIVAMVLPTNDGFVGLDSWTIPSEAGTYTVFLNAYDAGTEVNDEVIDTVNGGGDDGIPHIHRGNLGDTDLTGGVSDVDSRIHRWLNPVAKVVVTVK